MGLPQNRKYPWDEWLDGRVWELVPGQDFTVPVGNLRSTARSAAAVRGVSVRMSERGGIVLVQASPRLAVLHSLPDCRAEMADAIFTPLAALPLTG